MVSTPKPIPRMPGLPVLGNMLDLRRDRLGFFVRVREQCGGIGQYRRMSRLVTLLTDPLHIQAVVRDHADRTATPQQAQRFLGAIIGEGLAGDRSRYTEVFQPPRLADYAEVVTRQVDHMQRRWIDGSTIDLAQEMNRLALSIVTMTLFGTDASQDGADALFSALSDVLTTTNAMAQSLLPLPTASPARRFRAAMQRLDATIYRMIADRRSASDAPDDLLSLLVRSSDMTDQHVRDSAMAFFLAGLETTANTLTWMWYLLTRNPDNYGRMRDEIDRFIANRPPTFADLATIPYTVQVVKETLRLYPPIHLISRAIITPIPLVGGYQLDSGAYVIMSLYVLHRDPTVYPNPDRFDPERFTADAERHIPPFAYLPFGAGPRRCLGEPFAMMCLPLIAAAMSRHVILERVDQSPVQARALLTLRPREPIIAIVHRR